MLKTSKIFTIVIIVAVLGCVAFALHFAWRAMAETAYESCVASLTDAIVRQDAAIRIQEQHETWKMLDDTEVDSVMSGIKPGDCARAEDPKLDLWHNKIHIALRRASKENWPSIIVWSDGRDGIPGTADDIIMPFGQEIPRW